MKITQTQLRGIVAEVMTEAPKINTRPSSSNMQAEMLSDKLLDLENAIKTVIRLAPSVSRYLTTLNNKDLGNEQLSDDIEIMSFILEDFSSTGDKDISLLKKLVKTVEKAQKISASSNLKPRSSRFDDYMNSKLSK
jgi:hypothetical protein